MEEGVPVEETTTEAKPSRLPGWVKLVFIALVVIVALAHLVMSGWGSYLYASLKCGIRQPLIAHSRNSLTYDKPGDIQYSAPGEGVSFKGYYCSDAEARADGFLHVDTN